MREIEWLNHDKMKIETGLKAFDDATDAIFPGNVVLHTCTGSYIRSYDTTECNGIAFAPGHLRNVDLANFRDMPAYVRAYVESVTQDSQALCYELHHWNGTNKIIHGYVVTRGHDQDYKLLRTFVTGPTRKSEGVVRVSSEYLSNP